MTVAIIVHVGGGKTTYTRSGGHPRLKVVDVDALRDPALDVILKPLRMRNAWNDHNALWHAHLRSQLAVVTDTTDIMLMHSAADAIAMGLKPVAAVVVPDGEYLTRIRAMDSERGRLGVMNWALVRREAKRLNLPVFPDINSAVTAYLKED